MSIKNTEITGQIRKELEELTGSISKMMDVFRQIRQPIQESSDKVPTTTQQLERVTQQTEQATQKMLDIVESITNRESEIAKAAGKLKKAIPDSAVRDNPDIDKLCSGIQANADANLNDTMVIMEALQFQDITSQQIEHAVSQLEDIDTKLKALLVTTGAKKEANAPDPTRKTRAFDPNANYAVDHTTHQQDVDALISNIRKP
jgi:chemotaxis regulatin CheY-phosphate phosphatase CheZ